MKRHITIIDDEEGGSTVVEWMKAAGTLARSEAVQKRREAGLRKAADSNKREAAALSQKIDDLVRKGKLVDEIARALNVHPSTVYRHLRKR